MSDLERRVAEALRHGAELAPRAHGLAQAARARARQRRRTKVVTVGLAAALVVAVPTAVVAWPDPRVDTPDEAVAVEPILGSDAPASGYHWESWRTVTLQVPNTWGHGALSTWCISGEEPGDPVVERPGPVERVACSPTDGYGLAFSERAPDAGEIRWPVAAQSGDPWPEGAYVGARSLGDVVVTVVARESTVAQAVLDSARAIDGYDAHGCAETLGLDAVAPDAGMGVCRYDDEGRLEQSELLREDQAAAAENALGASATGFQRRCTTMPAQVVRMTSTAVRATAAIGACAYLTVDDRDCVLDADVLYWALSPGFSGDTTGLPLPPELRQE